MKRFKGFTFWGKKERVLGMMVALAVVMLLSGCGATAGEINAQTPGFFNHYVVFPLSWLIQQLAQWFGGSFGLAIMTLTLIVRLALLPLMMRQTRAQQGMKRKMSAMQPDLDQIKKKYENKKDAASQQSMQQEMMALYKEHQFNPLNIGCLPIFIQLPILSGMYTAIRLTPELASHSFLWFRLGRPDWILAVIVAVVYLAQAKLSQLQMTADQRKQFAIMGYLSPIMMAVFSFNAPAAMPLYWTVSGTFLLLQSLWFRKRYPTEEVETKAKLGKVTPT